MVGVSRPAPDITLHLRNLIHNRPGLAMGKIVEEDKMKIISIILLIALCFVLGYQYGYFNATVKAIKSYSEILKEIK